MKGCSKRDKKTTVHAMWVMSLTERRGSSCKTHTFRLYFNRPYAPLISSLWLFSTGTDLTPCQQEYMEGRFKPLCTPEGAYEDTQCQGTACFCVNERGDEIARSRIELPAKPNCTSAGILKDILDFKNAHRLFTMLLLSSDLHEQSF